MKLEDFLKNSCTAAEGKIVVRKISPPFDSESQVRKEEMPLPSVILPTYYLFQNVILIPCTPNFSFNPKYGTYERGRIAPWRKVVGGLETFLAALYYYVMNKIDRATVGNSTLRVISAVQGISGVIVIISFHVAMTYSAAKVAQILNGIQELTKACTQNGIDFPPARRIRAFAIAIIIFGSALIAAMTLTSVDGRHGRSIHQGPAAFAESTLVHHMKIGSALLLRVEADETAEITQQLNGNNYYFIATGTVFYFSWWTTVLWGGCFITTVGWIFMFWLLLDRFFKLIEKQSSGKLLDNMKKFHKIAALIEKYNEAFGLVTLMSVVGGGTYFSVKIYQVFNTTDEYLQRAVSIICLLWYAVMLGAAAMVHDKATRVLKVIYERFRGTLVWDLHDGTSMKTTQGMLLILHAVQTNQVGLQGLRFFTLTFPFVGTVYSAISTYAVIVIQLIS